MRLQAVTDTGFRVQGGGFSGQNDNRAKKVKWKIHEKVTGKRACRGLPEIDLKLIITRLLRVIEAPSLPALVVHAVP